MIETVIRKRIEVLADTALVKRVTAAIDRVGITGWTVLPVTAGSGRDGTWREEHVTGLDKSLILTIASQQRAAALAEALAPILTSHGLLLTMWDVEVIRGERFE
jgi:PII-like signaling protein